MQYHLPVDKELFARTFPQSRKLIPDDCWQQLLAAADSVELFASLVNTKAEELHLPGYIGELAQLELCTYRLTTDSVSLSPFSEHLSVNPTLHLFENSWKNLASLITEGLNTPEPEKGDEHVIVWLHPVSRRIRAKSAADEDLLVLKMALEELSAQDVSCQGGVPAAAVGAAMIRALNDGIVIGPEPLIKRKYRPEDFPALDPSFLTARIFSLQWHITQKCDLHCRHCYDRGQYTSLSLEQEINILDDFAGFCSSHNVFGQVTFTGGNPLLHPNFETLYREAAARGFTTAVLGNPATLDEVERLVAIQPPSFYQVSLEGLEEHNDYIRGRGHFAKVFRFLDLLREKNIFSMVMLTLTRDNAAQVLPLAELLRDKTDFFTFNRLSLVGEGANLAPVDIDDYPGFLQAYLDAVPENPCLGIKDNLLNILYQNRQQHVFGGCTGYGCGAAFNFMAVLADGSVHACRKFHSPLGNILANSLSEIYHSEAAERYRGGAAECLNCPIRPVCGGCLAVAHGSGRDIFRQKDPYCFINTGASGS